MVKFIFPFFWLFLLCACQNHEKIDKKLCQDLYAAITKCRECNRNSNELPFSPQRANHYLECQKSLFAEIRRIEALPDLNYYPKAKQMAFGYSLQLFANISYIDLGITTSFQEDFIIREGRFAQDFVSYIPENSNNPAHKTFMDNTLKLIDAILSLKPDSSTLLAQYPVPKDLQYHYGKTLSRKFIITSYESTGKYRLVLSKWKPVIDSLKSQFPKERIIAEFEKMYNATQIDSNFSLAYLSICLDKATSK